MTDTTWSRVRKLIVILLLGAMMTAVMFWIAKTNSEYAEAAMLPYTGSMAVLGLAYVSETVLRAFVTRMPMPRVLSGDDVSG